MKPTLRLLAILAAAGLMGLAWPTTLFAGGRHGGHCHGGSRWGFYGGYGGLYWAGWDDDWWWGLSIPLALSFTYSNYEPVRVSEPPRVEYRPAPQPATVVYRPESRKSPEDLMLEYARSKRSNHAEAIEATESVSGRADSAAGQSLTLADLKKLAAAGVGDAVIISQIRASGTVFHLTTDELLDLKQSGVSEKVLEHVVSTGQPPAAAPAPAR